MGSIFSLPLIFLCIPPLCEELRYSEKRSTQLCPEKFLCFRELPPNSWCTFDHLLGGELPVLTLHLAPRGPTHCITLFGDTHLIARANVLHHRSFLRMIHLNPLLCRETTDS